MWPDRVSNPGPPTYESGALPIALRGPAGKVCMLHVWVVGSILKCKQTQIQYLVIEVPRHIWAGTWCFQ